MIDLFIARDIETIRSQQEALRKEEEQEKGVQQDGQQAEVKAIQAGSEEDWWFVDWRDYLNSFILFYWNDW